VKIFTAIFYPAGDGGFIGYLAELRGLVTEGATLAEARSNLKESAELVIEVLKGVAVLDRSLRIEEPLFIDDEPAGSSAPPT
jgi:predicted RNase H-like HicB family nuclease